MNYRVNRFLYLGKPVKGPTKEEVEIALEKFLKEGGMIKKLPDAVTPNRIRIYPKYSSGFETSNQILQK